MNCRVLHDAGVSLPSCGTSQQGPGLVQVLEARPRGRGKVTGSWDPSPWDQRLLWD